jgi:hypothetical protein
MRRLLSTFMLPVWLLLAVLGGSHAVLGAATANKKADKETTLSKVEAAPVVVLQVQVPQLDLYVPAAYGITWHKVPQNQAFQPLRSNGYTAWPGFGHRFYATAIALRAP